MAVNNTLAQKGTDQSVSFSAGNEMVTLSLRVVRDYLVSGDKEKVSMQELVMFLNLCKFQHLNPFLREAYIVKYGNEPATIVTGKDAFAKRAQRNKEYKGVQAGVIVQKEDGTTENRIGSLSLPGEKLIGGWAKVYVNGYDVPIETAVSFEEYIGRKKDGSVNRQWTTKPATMIRKVAYVQALREAFPDDFAGMYEAEEMGVDANLLPDAPVELPSAPDTTFDDTPPPPDDYDPLG